MNSPRNRRCARAVVLALLAALLATPGLRSDDPPEGGSAELDKFVQTEAKGYEKGKKGAKLTPIVVSVKERRTPASIATLIDAALDRGREAAKIPASPPADDATFLRRAHLDLLGVIPTPERVRSFVASTDPNKRVKLIDELLADPQYGDHFAHLWHELLVKRDADTNRHIATHEVFLKWLGRQFNNNRPWDEVVRSMLTASGDPTLAGETFFLLANSEDGQPSPSKIVGTAAALFLGNQLMCAECHVHPMTREWTQQDFWGLAAFFGRTRSQGRANPKAPTFGFDRISEDPPAMAGKGKGAKAAQTAVLSDGSIPIPDPRNDGKFVGAARPRLMDDGPSVKRNEASRATLAAWFTSSTNPFFPRAAVNRLWAHYFARGFINPLDDIAPDSLPSHPEILQLLCEEFIVSRFDLKHLTRCVMLTRAYGRSSRTTPGNKDDEEHYSHMGVKVLPPRTLFRSLAAATGGQVALPVDEPPSRKAKDDTGRGLQFFDAREYDEPVGNYTYGVPQLMRLMNATLPGACEATAKSAARAGGPERVIERLYLSALSRQPTPAEVKKMTAFVARRPDPVKGYADVLWVLLNSAEFVNNH